MNHEKNAELIKKFEETGLEKKIIGLAEKAAKLGHYDESIGLLDNLLLIGAKDRKLVADLAIKYQKELNNSKSKVSSK